MAYRWRWSDGVVYTHGRAFNWLGHVPKLFRRCDKPESAGKVAENALKNRRFEVGPSQ